MYTAFATSEEAIALELIDCLNKLCEQHSLSNLFKHISFDGQLKLEAFDDFRDDKNVKKVWVCGPPGMNEEIDRKHFDYMKDPSNRLESAHVDYCFV